jgi:hypothetical protein
MVAIQVAVDPTSNALYETAGFYSPMSCELPRQLFGWSWFDECASRSYPQYLAAPPALGNPARSNAGDTDGRGRR